jgi:hypothetical protein
VKEREGLGALLCLIHAAVVRMHDCWSVDQQVIYELWWNAFMALRL